MGTIMTTLLRMRNFFSYRFLASARPMPRPWSSPLPFKRPTGRDGGAVAVEYALCILVAAAMLVGVEADIFRPMAKEVLKEFMEFIAQPYP